MLSGFYTAASGMLMNRRALDVSSNNMANQNTPGYRSKRLVGTTFENELVRIQGQQKTPIGGGAPISIVSEVQSKFDSTNIKDTGRPYDVAINGEGLFTVQGADGEYLTRNGNFDIDKDGYLELRGIGRVLGDNGPIEIKNSQFTIGKTGTVYSSFGNALDQLRIVQPDDYDSLIPMENGVYAAGGAQAQRIYPETFQGKVEASDVDLNEEMTRVMELQRAFQSCSKAVTIIDQMNQKTASEIGRL